VKWWLSIFLLCVILARSAEMRCSVFDLQSLTLSTHDPTIRHQLVLQWLKENGHKCSYDRLVYIQNRRPEWLGTADSIEIKNMINALLEK
jgi:hypothetical protein